jgi:transposase
MSWPTGRPAPSPTGSVSTPACRSSAGTVPEPTPLQGARDGAPDAIQVADRWHLWDNLGGYVEKTVAAHHRCLKDQQVVPEPPTAGEAPDMQQVAVQAAVTHAESRTRVVRTRQRYEQVQALKAQGKSITTIIRELGLAPGTVRKFYRAGSVQDLVAASLAGWPSKLDDYKPYLHQRWNSGCTNILQLHREIVALGYRGGDGIVYNYLASFGGLAAAPPAIPAPPKVRHITSWIRRRPANLDADEHLKLTNVLTACPHLNALSGHVKGFAEMMTGRHGDRLDTWIAAVRADDLPHLHTFANGLERDHAAVLAGLTLPHSSGAVEGNVNRIIMIKRTMFGRANLDLLRKIVLLG